MVHNSLTFAIPCLTPPSHTSLWPLCGSLPHNCFCTLTPSYPVTDPPNGSCDFEPTFQVPFLILVSLYSHLPTYEDGTDRVFRNVGI